MDCDELIQKYIELSKTCPNCGIVQGLVLRETEDKFEYLCPKCGTVRFCLYKAGDECVSFSPNWRGMLETKSTDQWKNCFF